METIYYSNLNGVNTEHEIKTEQFILQILEKLVYSDIKFTMAYSFHEYHQGLHAVECLRENIQENILKFDKWLINKSIDEEPYDEQTFIYWQCRLEAKIVHALSVAHTFATKYYGCLKKLYESNM